MTSTPHLLYIAFWYPPSRASGVYRALATTRAFVDAGWTVTVLTTTEDFLAKEIGSVDPTLVAVIPDGVEVIRIPFTFDPEIEMREIGRLRGNFPVAWRVWTDQIGSLKDSVRSWTGSAKPELREAYSTWIEPAVHTGLGTAASYDHILATGNPFSSFEVARQISMATEARYTVDFRDPWTIDVFTGGRASLPAGTEAAEKRIVEQAASCVHVNEPIAEAYRAKYPDQSGKQFVVINGFDPESIEVEPKEYSGGPIRFGMLGTVNDRWPLDPIFRAWDQVRTRLPEGSELLLAGHLGYFAKSAEPLEKRLPRSSEGFRFLGSLTKSEVAGYYASLDVVIVPVPGSMMVTSGKIFEAMGLGIPFICVQGRSGDARRVASSHPFSFPADPDAGSVANAMLEAVESRRSQDARQIKETRATMQAFDRNVTMRQLVSVISRAGHTR